MGYGDAWSYVARAMMNKRASEGKDPGLAEMERRQEEEQGIAEMQAAADMEDNALAQLDKAQAEQDAAAQRMNDAKGNFINQPITSAWDYLAGIFGKVKGGIAKQKAYSDARSKGIALPGDTGTPWWNTRTAQWLGIGASIAALGGGAYGVHKIRQVAKKKREEKEELLRQLLAEKNNAGKQSV